MKPLKLTLTAFGPYKDAETIDFRELEENDLYVISGNTGAGKTTIFDGVCFALYGTASGEDRENHMMLRSDFADDDTHTAAELEFELKGHTYRILRQLGHIKQGNKTKTGERYEFFEINNEREIPCVDRQIVSEINKKVESLMGLTEDQFKQIVMLPQGEFRKLLTSDTENKEEILRRLFKTDAYKQMGERLREKKSVAEDVYNQVKQTRDTYINHIKAVLPEREEAEVFRVLEEEYNNAKQVLSALEMEVEYYTSQTVVDEKAYHQANSNQEKMQEVYHQAKAMNDRFDELEQKKRLLKSLSEQNPSIERKEFVLEKSERAQKIEPEEERVREWREDQEAKDRNLITVKQDKFKVETALNHAIKEYETEEKNKEKREEIGKEVTRLQEFYPTVEKIDQEKQRLSQAKKTVDRIKGEVETLDAELKKKEEALEKYQQQIKVLEKTDATRLEKHQTFNELKSKMKSIMAYEQANAAVEESQKEHEKKKSVFEQTKVRYQQLEAAWLNNQAAVLASHLHEGENCPVCGSVDHPGKASHTTDEVSRDQLDVFKKEMDVKEKEYQTARDEYSRQTGRLSDRQTDLNELNIDVTEVSSIKENMIEQGRKLKEEIAQLDASKEKLERLKETTEILSNELKTLKQNREMNDKSYHENSSALAAELATYKERIRAIPEELRNLTVLKQKMSEMETTQKHLEQKWEQIQKNMQSARENFAKTETNLVNASKQLAESQQKREEAEKRFNLALENADFATEAIYREAKLKEEERQRLKDEIKQFHQTLSTTKEQVSELKKALQDKERADLNELEIELAAVRKASEEAARKWNQTIEYQKQATTLKEKISESSEKTVESEDKYNLIADLDNVIRGQNSKKVSFERYLQIDYLDQIIEAANLRLRDLSNGQYSLIRSERQEAHGRQSGLALDVYDEYTGQTRDVKSLSGGEKFNASLCLALGMSDVIQSFQGNISIETMFIDEGFGSLDEEALNKSIDTLIDLQQTGRMIGVISHVKELKSIFPAVLQVNKTKEGYSETQFIVK